MIEPLVKKPKGSFTKERRAKSRQRKRSESDIMQDALKRDGHRCRMPRWDEPCLSWHTGETVDPCHMTHRGMGGNPKGDRTTRQTVITLCRTHHRLYDAGQLEIEPLSDKLADGYCRFKIGITRGIVKTDIGVSAPPFFIKGVD